MLFEKLRTTSVHTGSCTTLQAQRSSNLELFRIVSMLLIVAHHYVVNSGILTPIYENYTWKRSLFLIIFGAWGKTAINCFVLITGYFMCMSNITLKKYAKLIGIVFFYKVILYIVFLMTGGLTFQPLSFFKFIFPIYQITNDFTPAYLAFYLFIPFLNILIKNITEKQHLKLIGLCAFTYILFGTLHFLTLKMNYVSWFMVVYFIGAYIRIYPKKIFDNVKFWLFMTILSVSMACLFTIARVFYEIETGASHFPLYFVSDSNAFFAVAVSISLFMLFKNIKIKYSKIINTVGATTFGILQIHAHSNAMRSWLWGDVLKSEQMFYSNMWLLHAVGSVLGIFTVCSFIDFLRIRFIERPFFKMWDKISDEKKSQKSNGDIITEKCAEEKTNEYNPEADKIGELSVKQ